MIEKEQNQSPQRRAFNIIWTAAGDYQFEPDFTAFFQDGQPDFYMNSIIGYVRKWYDPQVIGQLFDALKDSFFHETMEGLVWVALENCTYEKESALRPVLAELRRSHAKEFFRQEQNLSRQQWMAQNSLVYALQAAKCREVLGKDSGLIRPREKKLYQELQYSGQLSSQEIADRTLDILRRYFHFTKSTGKASRLQRFFLKLKTIGARPLPFNITRSQNLLIGSTNVSAAGHQLTAASILGNHRQPTPKGSDRLYIQGCFGQSIYSPEEEEKLTLTLCQEAHQNCRLFFTDGEPAMPPSHDPLVLKTLADGRKQGEKNRAAYRSHSSFHQRNILRLAEQIRNSMLVYSQPLPVQSKSGRFHPAQVWRALTLSDPRVFMDSIQEEFPDFSVDLLLDASASRLQTQELIAAQAFILASSLQLCRVPVQVTSFLSVRGYTVLRRFCRYQSASDGPDACRQRTDKIFAYFAAGWNRDGLAFRGMSRLMAESPCKNRLLIVLTDASPNDDRKIPPAPRKGRLISADYSGKAGIQDTAQEVQKLRRENIQVMAILNGADGGTEAARQIYGEDYVRIENLNQLSQAAGQLIQKQIERARC